jgi:hypothetical protein
MDTAGVPEPFDYGFWPDSWLDGFLNNSDYPVQTLTPAGANYVSRNNSADTFHATDPRWIIP